MNVDAEVLATLRERAVNAQRYNRASLDITPALLLALLDWLEDR